MPRWSEASWKEVGATATRAPSWAWKKDRLAPRSRAYSRAQAGASGVASTTRPAGSATTLKRNAGMRRTPRRMRPISAGSPRSRGGARAKLAASATSRALTTAWAWNCFSTWRGK